MKELETEILNLRLLGFGIDEISRKLKNNGIKVPRRYIVSILKKVSSKIYKSFIIKDLKAITNSYKNVIILSANIRRGKGSIIVEFSLDCLRKLALNKEIRILPYLSEDLKNILIVKSKISKEKLSPKKDNAAIRFCISRFIDNRRSELPKNVNLIIPLDSFGIHPTKTIQDKDGKKLFSVLNKREWSLDGKRATDSNGLADMYVISPTKRKFIIEITSEGKTSQFRYKIRLSLRQRLAGKAFLQNVVAKKLNSIYVMILWKGLIDKKVITKKFIEACRFYGVNLIFTDFDSRWRYKVADQLTRLC